MGVAMPAKQDAVMDTVLGSASQLGEVATAETLIGIRLFARHRLMLCILLGFIAAPELPINTIFC